MRLCLERLSEDWHHTYGHAVLIAESFVDSQRFSGTCYKASGWTLLGQTQGFQRTRQDFYLAHERPKQQWVRELHPGARTRLRGRHLPEALQRGEQNHPPECFQAPEELKAMTRYFRGLTDWRQGATDFPLSSLLAAVSATAPPSSTWA
jgi:hypothetical protein